MSQAPSATAAPKGRAPPPGRAGGAPLADRTGGAPLPDRALRWLIALLVLHSGVFFGLVSPARPNAIAWPIAFVPLFLALDLALRRYPGTARGTGRSTWRGTWRGAAWRVLACTVPVGIGFAAISGDWVVNTAYVYGGLSLPLAYAVSWFGYGLLIGLEVALCLGLPFALTWRRPLAGLFVIPLWCTVLQVYLPRFLFFTYGQAMAPLLPLVQVADTGGSGGLNLLYLPLQLVLYAWLRRLYAPGELPLRALGAATVALALAFALDYGYGTRALAMWRARQAAGAPVELVGIQPDFSLKRLASNPDRSYSDREQSLRGLLDDSAAALTRAQRAPGVPTVLLWPESVYPQPYLLARDMRELVERWVQSQRVHLILATVDGRSVRTPDGRVIPEIYGAAVHVAPDGQPRAVYHKIALIPWGETIPLADVIPGYRRLLLDWIPQISEFTPGRAHTVFEVDGVRIAPMICFDAAVAGVAQGMAANGARLGVVLSNLAWFGRTSVSRQFGLYVRFRAIENRMPILLLSQNGETFLVDATGEDGSPHLPQFHTAAFVQQVRAPRESSFYAFHAAAIHAGYAAALLLALALAFGRPLLARMRPRDRE